MNTNSNTNAISNAVGTSSLYSTPELIDTIVTDKAIELVYTKKLMMCDGLGNYPTPEIYKDVYSRFDGSVTQVKGEYIPSQKESYSFD